jgi:hypothetical protein
MSSQSDRAKRPRQYLVVIFANLLIIAAGVVVFSLVFRRHLEEVPASNYEVRDDAVITLSHARNLIDYGFIGVSPSGERVEGFSAPLQFWVAALAYASDGVDYRTFCRWQTTIGTLLLGGVFAALMFQPTRAQTSIWYVLFAVSAVLASADILAHSRAFLLWHASGMENPYTHVLLIALVGALDFMLQRKRVVTTAVVLVVAAASVRIDAIVDVVILLAVFGGLWRLKHRDNGGLRSLIVCLVPWALYMGWRWWYFGQWEPNTGVA